MKQFIISTFICISLWSCRHVTNHLNLNHVVQDTSVIRNGSYILKTLPELSTKLMLPPINKGTDSFEFRFWLPNRTTEVMNILCIRYVDSEWISSVIAFLPHLPGNGNNYERFKQTELRNLKVSTINPDISIDQFVDSLALLDLQSSPPNSEIEDGLDISKAPTRYMLEFADKENYRVIHYFLTNRKPRKIAFDDKFLSLIGLIKRHYKIDF